MNFVVTGSEGFLGRAVVARLAAAGRTVVGVDRVYHREIPPPNVTCHHADLEDPLTLIPPAFAAAPFTLIHLAWDMRRYEGYAIQAGQIRILASLLDYWGSRGLQKIVFMGSAEEFGQRNGLIAEADQPGLPLSPYGWAKRSSRNVIESWSMKTRIPAIILRPFVMYGAGQKGDMLIPSAIESARQKQPAGFTDGQQQRDFVHIDDVVEAINRAVDAELPGFHEFNLGRGEGVRVADILLTIAAHFNAGELFTLGAKPRRPGEPDQQIANCARARDLLGWTANVDWQTGIRRTME